MNLLPSCPICHSGFTYEDRGLFVCPECAHEWAIESSVGDETNIFIVKDSNGNVLNEGDYVTLVKDLKLKGSSTVLKVGTKIKINRLVDSDHDIDCKVEGIGSMALKSEFVKKIN